ncbi:hypothetical protein IE077_001587, partial [Cardiosporidium cionae]
NLIGTTTTDWHTATLSVLFVTILAESQDYHLKWRVDSLLQDSYKMIPLPKNIGGGILVVSADAITVVQLHGYCFTQILNCVGMTRKDIFTLCMPVFDQSHLQLRLDGSGCSCITSDTLLVSAKDSGNLVFGHLVHTRKEVTDIFWSFIESREEVTFPSGFSSAMPSTNFQIPTSLICTLPCRNTSLQPRISPSLEETEAFSTSIVENTSLSGFSYSSCLPALEQTRHASSFYVVIGGDALA